MNSRSKLTFSNTERQARRFLSTFALASSAYLFTTGFRCGLRHNKPYVYIYGLFLRVIFKPHRSACTISGSNSCVSRGRVRTTSVPDASPFHVGIVRN